MTDFEALAKLRIPSDLTKDQIYELFRLSCYLSYAVARKKPEYIINQRRDELTAWFMSQNFHHQINID